MIASNTHATVDGKQLPTFLESPEAAEVETLTLKQAKLTEKRAALVGALPKLRRLIAPRSSFNAKKLRALSDALPEGQLEALDLRGNRVMPDGAEILASAPAFSGLREIDLMATRLSADSIRELVAGPSLRGLTHWASGSDKFGPAGLSAITEGPWPLVSFSSCRQKLGVEAMSELVRRDTPRLRRLRLLEVGAGPKLTAAIAHSEAMAELESLEFRYDSINDKAIQFLAHSPHLGSLRRFQSSQCRVTEKGIEALVRAPFFSQLESLDIGTNRFGHLVAPILAEASSGGAMEQLTLSSTPLGAHGLDQLLAGAWPALKRLELAWCRIGDSGVRALLDWPGLARLVALGVGTNDVTAKGLRALVDHPSVANLEQLTISQDPCVAEHVAIGEQAKHLRPGALRVALTLS